MCRILDHMIRRIGRVTGTALIGIAALYVAMTCVGIGWGLPSTKDDDRLFGGQAWSGAEIIERGGGEARRDQAAGADVDVNPLDAQRSPIVLNDTLAAQAEIYRRYRLFTRQPDEMIVMMSLSGMDPKAFRLDPKLYQYGGLFIYPVGGLIGACGAMGVFPVTGDLSYYLDHPEAFGAFYVTARLYAAAWGLVGIGIVFAIGRRLGGSSAGLLAALLFVFLPVVTCMSHEAKPHLPGAVLMLTAVWLGMRALDRQRLFDWISMYVCCGAAVGMVLSSVPILILIPTVLAMHCRNQILRERNEETCERRRADYRLAFVRATLGGWAIAAAVYLVTNPYVAINAITNRAVLASNFGNSFAMYALDRVGEGALRVLQLSIEGATWPVVVVGIMAAGIGIRRRTWNALPMSVPAVAFLLQFVLIGAGKPDEYGRFGVFYESVLAIGCACVVVGLIRRSKWGGSTVAVLLVGWCAVCSSGYLWSFHADTVGDGSRDRAASYLASHHPQESIAVIAEPAPYACPPIDFAHQNVIHWRRNAGDNRIDRIRLWNDALRKAREGKAPDELAPPAILVAALDDPVDDLAEIDDPAWTGVRVFESRCRLLPRGRISWANKPIVLLSVESIAANDPNDKD